MANAAETAWNTLAEHRLPDGGFALHPRGEFRPDATAWAIIASALNGRTGAGLTQTAARLAAVQQPDGRVPLYPTHPNVAWPTALAAIAWALADERPAERVLACSFLLSNPGRLPASINRDVADDNGLRGWPWTLETYSWVPPTALAVLALKLAGAAAGPSLREAVAMLRNRQLKGGGWNCGNTIVYGSQLRPFADTSGMALAALAGSVEPGAIADSVRFLEKEAARVRTAVSLGWAALGLAAWGRRPAPCDAWIDEALARQPASGAQDTVSLAVLLAARGAREGLLGKARGKVR